MLSGKKLFQKNIDDINIKDIQELVENKISEDSYLEYKTPSSEDRQKLKFNNKEKSKMLKEISGFATSNGGLLIYGITEDKNHNPNEVSGIEITNNHDELSSQVISIITDNLEPTLKPTCNVKLLKLLDVKYILIIKVFKGFNGPYRTLLDKKDFYIRRGNKTEPMDSSEIKQHISNDNGESERLLSENPQPLLDLHAKLSKIYPARCNLVHMFDNTRRTQDQEKYYGYIINSREELFNYLYKLTGNIKKFYFIPSDLKKSINQYVDHCEKEEEYWEGRSKKIHYRPAEDLTFRYVDNIFYITEKHAKAKIKKSNRPQLL